MDLRKNRKGMVAIVDALVFISILSIAAFGFFAYSNYSDMEEPMAESVSKDLFSMELKACDLCDVPDTSVFPIYVLISINMITDDTERTESFLKDTLDDLVPGHCGYHLTIEYHGRTLTVERPGHSEESSSYERSFIIDDANEMLSELVIY